MNDFAEHGTFKIWQEGQFMIIEGSGPWNLQSLEASAKEAQAAQNKLYGKPWGAIAVIHDQPIHVPDAATLLVEFVKRDIDNGRVGSALLVGACDSPQFAKNHIADIYSRAGEIYEFFDDLDTAKTWLQSRIDAANGS